MPRGSKPTAAEATERTLRERCGRLVENLGLGASQDIISATPLTGGVASDIAAIDLGDRRICVKFALARLRVAEDWYAPVERHQAEYAWLEFAGNVSPGCVPALFGCDAETQGFAMEFIEGADVYLWKTALLERQANRGEAAKVGRTLGQIHAASAKPIFDASAFQNQSTFRQIRLEPYLAFTAKIHQGIGATLQRLIDSQQRDVRALVHGDVSPKNLLFRGGQPIFLDAECATMGDPAFDVAFCLNHLALKSWHMPDRADELLTGLMAFWNSYAPQVDWEEAAQIEARVCALLPALMLARVDGKSPVEYLSERNRERVREASLAWVAKPPSSLQQFAARVRVAAG